MSQFIQRIKKWFSGKRDRLCESIVRYGYHYHDHIPPTSSIVQMIYAASRSLPNEQVALFEIGRPFNYNDLVSELKNRGLQVFPSYEDAYKFGQLYIDYFGKYVIDNQKHRPIIFAHPLIQPFVFPCNGLLRLLPGEMSDPLFNMGPRLIPCALPSNGNTWSERHMIAAVKHAIPENTSQVIT